MEMDQVVLEMMNQKARDAAWEATNLLMTKVADFVEVSDDNPHDFGGWAALYASEIESRLDDFFTDAVVDWEKWVERCEKEDA